MIPVVAVAAAVTVLPASAQAYARFGSALEADPNTSPACPTSSDCSDVQAGWHNDIPPGAPIDGVVTRWRVRVGVTGPVTFQVVRLTGLSVYRAVAEDTQTTTQGGINEFKVGIPIHRGDLLGVHVAAGASPLRTTSDSHDIITRFDPPLGDSPVTGTTGLSSTELLVNVDIEPDVDGDGFGDETQDLCPASAATQTACSGVLVGPDLRGDRGDWVGLLTGPAETTIVSDSTPQGATIPSDGVIVRWRVRPLSGTFRPRIVRVGSNGSNSTVQAIRSGEAVALASSGDSNFRTGVAVEPTRLPVSAGDVLAIGLGPSGGGLSSRPTGSRLLTAHGASDGGPAVNATQFPGTSTIGIDGDLEPDGDHDSYGDITQDGCPTDAATQGACKTGPGPGPVTQIVKASGVAKVAAKSVNWNGGSTLTIPLSCAADIVTCAGKLTVTASGKRGKRRSKLGLGSKRFSIPGGATRGVALRLKKKQRTRLAKLRKVKLTARITPDPGPAQQSVTLVPVKR